MVYITTNILRTQMNEHRGRMSISATRIKQLLNVPIVTKLTSLTNSYLLLKIIILITKKVGHTNSLANHPDPEDGDFGLHNPETPPT